MQMVSRPGTTETFQSCGFADKIIENCVPYYEVVTNESLKWMITLQSEDPGVLIVQDSWREWKLMCCHLPGVPWTLKVRRLQRLLVEFRPGNPRSTDFHNVFSTQKNIEVTFLDDVEKHFQRNNR